MSLSVTALFTCLLLAHLLGDFVLQTDEDIQHKRRAGRFAKHILIVAGLSYLLVGVWTAWWIPLVIGLTHALIDMAKLRLETAGWTGRTPFFLDQAAHLAVIVGLALGAEHLGLADSGWPEVLGPLYLQGCLLLSGFILTVFAGGFVIGMWVEPYAREVGLPGMEIEGEVRPEAGLAKGGMVIGQLERGLIFFFVLVGQPEAVAFLVAAKSVFRFGELSKSRK
ncbi:MAG: DUF3307 domain-containing protein, partial [Opitutales bacterium]